MKSIPHWTRGIIMALASFSPSVFAAPLNPPTTSPDSVSARAPLNVTLGSGIPDASIYVTLDGSDPTTRDTELDPGSTILLDEPCTLKARVILADGSASPVKVSVYSLMPTKGLAASFVEQEVPAVMTTGQARDVEIVFRNLGTTPWEPGRVSLVPRRAKQGVMWRASKAELQEAASTWKPGIFSFRVVAPSEPGTYNFQWQLQDSEGKTFGEATPVMRVRVVPPEQAPGGQTSGPVAADDSRSTRGAIAAGATSGTDGSHSRKVTTAAEVRLAKAERFASEKGVKPGSDLYPLVRALSASPHSFKALRQRGFKQSDAEFEKIIADHPALFRSTRIIRRDKNGKRVIPGWPAVALRL